MRSYTESEIVKIITGDGPEAKQLFGIQRKIAFLEKAFMGTKNSKEKSAAWDEMQELISAREEVIKLALRRA